ncbi:MAG: GreA/GreB family elongation factor [Patescibacteria group bacterium]
MDKIGLLKQIESKLEDEIVAAERARKDAQDEANSHKGAMQSRYDTFKEEAQDKAAAYAQRKAELSDLLSVIRNFVSSSFIPQPGGIIRVGSIILLMSGDEEKRYILAPAGGGMELIVGSDEILVITLSSPLGRILMGKKTGEEVHLCIQNKVITHQIMEVL